MLEIDKNLLHYLKVMNVRKISDLPILFSINSFSRKDRICMHVNVN